MGFEVEVMGSSVCPRNMLPAASTLMFTMPSTLHVSMCVTSLAQLPCPGCSSRYTDTLVFVMPDTFAMTFDVPHGEPPQLV